MTLTDIQHRLRLPEVLLQTGLSYTTLYRLMKAGTFPKPNHSPGRRAVWWDAESVAEWVRVNRAAPAAESL